MNSPGSANFVFPIKDRLESDRVVLTAWNVSSAPRPYLWCSHSSQRSKPSIHSQLFYEESRSCKEIFQYLPWGPFDTVDEMSSMLAKRVLNDPTWCIFAIFVKPGVPDRDGKTNGEADGRFAGTIGLLNTVYNDACTEIGMV